MTQRFEALYVIVRQDDDEPPLRQWFVSFADRERFAEDFLKEHSSGIVDEMGGKWIEGDPTSAHLAVGWLGLLNEVEQEIKDKFDDMDSER